MLTYYLISNAYITRRNKNSFINYTDATCSKKNEEQKLICKQGRQVY